MKILDDIISASKKKRNRKILLIIFIIVMCILLFQVAFYLIIRVRDYKENSELTDIRWTHRVSEFKGENFRDVYSTIINEGYRNVLVQADNDLILGVFNEGNTVKKVIINGKDIYFPPFWVGYDDEIVIIYHAFRTEGEYYE